MPITEIPHSVRVTPKESPDTTSLSLTIDGIKVIEPEGQKARKNKILGRSFLLKRAEDETSITYHPSEELDRLVFHPHEKRSSHYVARNGIYIQMGIVNGLGKAMAQYDISNGRMLSAHADLDSFPQFEVPTNIDPDEINSIVDLFTSFKNPQTPIPTKLSQTSDFILSRIQFSESYQQQHLFEI